MWAMQKKRRSEPDEAMPPMSWSEGRWLSAAIVLFLAAHLIVWEMDEAAYRAAKVDKPPAGACSLPGGRPAVLGASGGPEGSL